MSGKSLKMVVIAVTAFIVLLTAASAVNAAPLLNVSVSLSNYGAGQTSKMNVSFQVGSYLTSDGGIVIDLNNQPNPGAGFNITKATLDYINIAGNGNFTLITHPYPNGNDIIIMRDGTGTPLAAGTWVNLTIGNLTNPTVTGLQNISIYTITSAGTIIDGPNITSVTIVPGPVKQFWIKNATGYDISNQTAGVPFGITVTARDAYGNLNTSYNGKVNISDTTNTINITNVTLTNGVGAATVVITSANNGSPVKIIASNSSINVTSYSNEFYVLPNNWTKIIISSLPNPIYANLPFNITVKLYDAYGNLELGKAYNVSFGDLGSTTTSTYLNVTKVISGGSLIGVNEVHVVNGVATVSAVVDYTGPTWPLKYNVTAFGKNESGVTISNVTANVNVTYLPIDTVNSTITVVPAVVPADGSSSATVYVKVLNNVTHTPVPGFTVYLFSDRGPTDYISTTLPATGYPGVGVTNSSGVAVFYVSSTTVGTANLTAVVNSGGVNFTLQKKGVVEFSGVLGNEITTKVKALKPWAVANGVDKIPVEVEVLNANLTPVQNALVRLSVNTTASTVNPAYVSFSPAYAYTNASGIAIINVSSKQYGNVTFNVYIDTLPTKNTTTVTFYPVINRTVVKVLGLGDMTKPIPADNVSYGIIKVIPYDLSNKPITNYRIVSIKSNKTSDKIVYTTMYSPQWGSATAWYIKTSNATPSNLSVTVSVSYPDGSEDVYTGSSVQAVWTANTTNATNSAVKTLTPEVRIDSTHAKIEVTIKDSAGNVLPNTNVTIVCDKLGWSSYNYTNGSGIAMFDYYKPAITPGSYVFSVYVGKELIGNATVTFYVSHNGYYVNAWYVEPSYVVALGNNNSVTADVYMQILYDNSPVPNEAVKILSVGSAFATIAPNAIVTNSTGWIHFKVTTSQVGDVNLTILIGSDVIRNNMWVLRVIPSWPTISVPPTLTTNEDTVRAVHNVTFAVRAPTSVYGVAVYKDTKVFVDGVQTWTITGLSANLSTTLNEGRHNITAYSEYEITGPNGYVKVLTTPNATLSYVIDNTGPRIAMQNTTYYANQNVTIELSDALSGVADHPAVVKQGFESRHYYDGPVTSNYLGIWYVSGNYSSAAIYFDKIELGYYDWIDVYEGYPGANKLVAVMSWMGIGMPLYGINIPWTQMGPNHSQWVRVPLSKKELPTLPTNGNAYVVYGVSGGNYVQLGYGFSAPIIVYGTGYRVYLDGNDITNSVKFVNNTLVIPAADVPAGNHTIKVIATDNVGNANLMVFNITKLNTSNATTPTNTTNNTNTTLTPQQVFNEIMTAIDEYAHASTPQEKVQIFNKIMQLINEYVELVH